jgi:hypothetical protein
MSHGGKSPCHLIPSVCKIDSILAAQPGYALPPIIYLRHLESFRYLYNHLVFNWIYLQSVLKSFVLTLSKLDIVSIIQSLLPTFVDFDPIYRASTD